MKRASILILSAATLTSCCSTVIMKQAHVIPILGYQVLLSAKPMFLGDTDSIYDDRTFKTPIAWAYEKRPDGSMRIVWITRRSTKEKLVLIDSGIHPAPVPAEAIFIIDRKSLALPVSEPAKLQMDANTAFLREEVTLVPYHKAEHGSRGNTASRRASP